jgi:tRNA(Ile)-lysidine synthase
MAALEPFERRPGVAVAVSGGADSLALCLLTAEWAAARGGAALGLHVDHALRRGSDLEAERVRRWLTARGIACHVLRWTHEAISSRLQERAREARLDLLQRACREAGILHLLLAHHRRDQAETVAMRALRGGAAGLAGMPSVREIQGLRLLRPLLGVEPARLRATLRLRRQPWIEDPSNADPRFERARLRRSPGFTHEVWLARAAEAISPRLDLEAECRRLLACSASLHPLGFARQNWLALAAAPQAIAVATLARLIMTIGGGRYPPPRLATIALLRALEAGKMGAATLGGCQIARQGPRLVVTREPGRLRDAAPLAQMTGRMWDGRFGVAPLLGQTALAGASDREILVAMVGKEGRRQLPQDLRHELRRQRIPADAIATLPAAWRQDRLLACPPLAWPSGPDDRCFTARFSPYALLTTAPFSSGIVV